ncbi:MAG: diaminopimelate decarboxylase [Pseudomonadota bacterium]
MDHFSYRGGVLHAEDAPIPEIAAAVGTPFYLYSTATLERHYQVMAEALSGVGDGRPLIAFAVKSNPNLAVIATLARLGAGADVVSEGELRRALAAGAPPEQIVFSGVGKTADEMRFALQAGVGQFNVESAEELEALDAVARAEGRRAPIALRVNPDVDPRTHAKISTGQAETKFGVPISAAREVYRRAAALESVEVIGVDVHIGSQLTELEPFETAFARVATLIGMLREDGHAIRRIDLGGGLGVPYLRSNAAPPLPFDYGAVIRRSVGALGCQIVVEPGRLIAGNAGLLVTKVLYRKQGEGRVFMICDAAMNDLLRPAMYEAWHDIEPVIEPPSDAPLAPADVVGPVCETGDIFAKARALPPFAPGDLFVFRTAGAYGAAMASEYNSRPLVPEAIVNGSEFAVVRPRPTYDEMLGRDRLPDWLS